jgi:hypothetical protein
LTQRLSAEAGAELRKVLPQIQARLKVAGAPFSAEPEDVMRFLN